MSTRTRVRTGSLRHRVAVQREAESRDAHGGVTRSWTTLATRYASVQPLSGREMLAGDQVRTDISHRVMMRHHIGLTSRDRLMYPRRPSTTVTTAIDDTETSLVVASSAGFPTDSEHPYWIRIQNELIKVTAGHGTTNWTIARGEFGTTAADHDDAISIHEMAVLAIVGAPIDPDGRGITHEVMCREETT